MQNIKIEKLNKCYGDHIVFHQFSCEIPAGQVTCLNGPSGCGKTTLLRILMNLEKPDSGKITGLDQGKIAAVFQEDRLCENLSVRTNLELVAPSGNLEEAIGCMDLQAEVLNQKVGELSGGMKRRVAILRALLADYDLLILDEPFKGLDVELKEKVMDYVWKKSVGKTVIFVTHDPLELEKFNQMNTVTLVNG